MNIIKTMEGSLKTARKGAVTDMKMRVMRMINIQATAAVSAAGRASILRMKQEAAAEKMISIPRKTLVMLMIFFIVAAGGAGFGSSLLVNKYFPYGLESNGSSSSDSNSAKTRTVRF